MNLSAIGTELQTVWGFVFAHLWETTLVWMLLLVIAVVARRGPARLHDALGWLALVKLAVPFALAAALLQPLGDGLTSAWQSVARFLGLSVGSGMDPGAAWLPAVESVWRTPAGGLETSAGWLLHPWVIVAATAVWVATSAVLLSRVVTSFLNGHKPDPSEVSVETMSIEAMNSDDGVDTSSETLRDAVRIAARSIEHRADAGRADKLEAELLRSIRVGTAPRMPSVAGLWNPRIYIPRDLLHRLGAPELAAILLHEYEHVRRRDPARVLLLGMISAALFFFLPLWPLTKRLRTTAELACDEAVIRAGVAPEVLAGALAQVLHARLIPETSRVALGSRPSQFKRRLVHLRNAERSFSMWKHRLVLGVAVLGVVGLGAMAAISNSGASNAKDLKGETAKQANDTSKEYEVSDFDTPPSPIPESLVQPEYPKECQTEGSDGRAMVYIQLVVSESGDVVEAVEQDNPKTQSDCAGYAKNAISAVSKWRFEPASLDGKPVQVKIVVPVRFELEKKDQSSLRTIFDSDTEDAC